MPDTPAPKPTAKRPSKRGSGDGYISQRRDQDGKPLKGQWRGEIMLGQKTIRTPAGQLVTRPDIRYVSGATRAEVAQQLHTLRQAAHTGTLAAPDKRTVGEHLQRWLTEVADTTTRVTTARNHRTHANRQILPALGHVKLTELRPEQIQTFYASLAARNYATNHIDGVASTLRAALDNAVTLGLLTRNPADGVKRPRTHHADIHPLTADQARHLLATAADPATFPRATAPPAGDDATPADDPDPLGPAIRALVTLAAGTGARLGELLALRWSDVDLEPASASVTIQRTQVNTTTRPPKYHEPKTAGSRRPITLGPQTLAELKRWKRTQAEQRVLLGPDWPDYGPDHAGERERVYTLPTGDALYATAVWPRWKRLLAAAHLPAATRFHDLRHTHATLLLAAGVSPKIVASRLGHSSVKTTLDRYSHYIRALDERAATDLDRALYDAPTGSATSGGVPAASKKPTPTTRKERGA